MSYRHRVEQNRIISTRTTITIIYACGAHGETSRNRSHKPALIVWSRLCLLLLCTANGDYSRTTGGWTGGLRMDYGELRGDDGGSEGLNETGAGITDAWSRWNNAKSMELGNILCYFGRLVLSWSPGSGRPPQALCRGGSRGTNGDCSPPPFYCKI